MREVSIGLWPDELLHHELVAAELDLMLMREVIIGNQKHSEAISGR